MLHGLNVMLRRFFPFLLIIFCGLIGWWALSKSRGPSSPSVQSGLTHRSSAPRQLTPPASRLAFLTDLSKPYDVRIQLLRDSLESGCSEPEMQFLYHLLETGPAAAELPQHGYMVANDIMAELIKHEKDLPRYVSQFTALLNDQRQPEVIRDYAVQYLGLLVDPRNSASEKATRLSPEMFTQVLKSLVTAATDPSLSQTSVPGTVLVTFAKLANSGKGLNGDPSVALIVPFIRQALAEGSTLGLGTQVPAVIAAGALAPVDFRPTLRKIAYQPDGEGALQLPALASLGKVGDLTDVEALQKVAASHPRLAYAATDACRVLTARLGGEPQKVSQ
jgi:hypothetical protein